MAGASKSSVNFFVAEKREIDHEKKRDVSCSMITPSESSSQNQGLSGFGRSLFFSLTDIIFTLCKKTRHMFFHFILIRLRFADNYLIFSAT